MHLSADILIIRIYFFIMEQQPQWTKASSLFRIHDHTQTHHSVGPPGWVISLTQRPLPDKTQYSQEADIHAPSGIRTHNPSMATRIGNYKNMHGINNIKNQMVFSNCSLSWHLQIHCLFKYKHFQSQNSTAYHKYRITDNGCCIIIIK